MLKYSLIDISKINLVNRLRAGRYPLRRILERTRWLRAFNAQWPSSGRKASRSNCDLQRVALLRHLTVVQISPIRSVGLSGIGAFTGLRRWLRVEVGKSAVQVRSPRKCDLLGG